MPQMAESISEGTLKSWLKKVGESVEADEEVATIETDKVCRPSLLEILSLCESTEPVSPGTLDRRLRERSRGRQDHGVSRERRGHG